MSAGCSLEQRLNGVPKLLRPTKVMAIFHSLLRFSHLFFNESFIQEQYIFSGG
jgi:hypothetical protein